ncbi:bifunctional glycosyltransferase/CDP-glycerol:glycerophosphate glycerophosphotransferase [Streptomyces sp. NBC_01465]|uniref:bifunctional glycosyltransferase/CDP-glycerol:glycerophosphate glycerophosphotransferase n=1 Tax=Streptomyces sp. NBC_01465 TaxID=2903878 RepID=UPI002E349FC3|nr:bifunctional glycosyltransferase family 2 protein/CDP-glycerol:glycerophosphate glycerophosphotransferase [Streptomyces sp. NBC_01465]
MPPRLSVVVPIYNVEDYLGECLRSLAEQTFPDLEVVMVDDGSPDGSADIARRFAAQDARFRLVVQENAGLGAARNTGVAHADPEAEFLAFVDSDDVIPPDAYALLVAALDGSGSDFASGNVMRLRTSGKLQQSPNFRRPMASTRMRTHITRDWDLAADRIACNKVFRRAFWEKHSFAFPVGSLYEDIPVVLPAQFLAESVDVVKNTVYHWRDRDGSITTRRAVVRGIEDRVAHVTHVSTFLKERGDTGHKAHYEAHVLANDLWYFMEVLPDGSSDYQQAFLTCANAFADQTEPGVLEGLPVRLRLMWHLARERRLEELLGLLAFDKANPGAFAVRGIRRRRAQYPPLQRPVPASVLRVADTDLPLTARLLEAYWRDGKLQLRGFAYVRNLPAASRRSEVKAAWLRAGGRKVLPLRVRTVADAEATARSRQRLHRYDWAGFETAVDPGRLSSEGDGTAWRLEIGVAGHGMLRRAALGPADAPTPPAVHRPDATSRIVPAFEDGKLVLYAEPVRSRIDTHRLSGDTVLLEGTLVGEGPGQGPFTLRLKHRHSAAVVDCPVTVRKSAFTAEVALAAVADVHKTEARPVDPYSVHLVDRTGRRTPVDAPGTFQPGRYPLGDGGRELCVTASARGNLQIGDQTVQPLVDRAGWSGEGELVMEGSYPQGASYNVELVAQHSVHREEIVFPAQYENGRFRAALHPHAVTGPGGDLPLAEGNWYFFLRAPGSEQDSPGVPMRLLPALHAAVPAQRRLNERDFTLERRYHDQLLLTSGSVLAAEERGTHGQQRLQETYRAARTEPLKPAVLYSSFDGRQHSDSPRAIHEELLSRGGELEHLCVVRDQQAQLPTGARAVAHGSTAWHEALARSRYVVTNTQLPEWFERREGQYVVQTWHGTPLKRIGIDLSGTVQANEPYIASLPQRARQWNLLVSPNRFSTPVLRRSFGYEGEVLESGYPRNALLHAPDREKIAASVRERLGIPEGKRVVLYAPTWREDRPAGGGRYALDLRLDLTAAEEALGGSTVMLVRRHYLVTDRLPGTGDGFVRDVSRYPDVAELMLISDVLVTDYSSLMFDFAHTRRPMLFHTYDLEHYRDTLRGFCFDFESQAPGPLIPGSTDLIEALRAPATATESYAEAYEAFREVFCDLDDGTAAAAVVDRMLAADGA